ncbi:MAG: extracellular solute-binding protein [Ruminococcus sp.]|nr:extracellular solute-binding protein [Ruminococcus sp.]
MKNTKKTIAGIMAFAMMLTLASCGDNKNSESGDASNNSSSADSANSNNNSSTDIAQIMDKSYKAIEIDADIPLNYINKVCALGDDGTVLISGGTEDGKSKMYTTDHEFAVFNEIPFELEEVENGESYYNPIIGKDGTIYLYVSITTYGMEKPDWEDENFDSENFDWEAFYNSAETTYKLYTIERDGTILTENEISGLDKYMDTDDDENRVYIGQMFALGDKLVVNISSNNGDEVFVTVNADGEIGDEIDVGDSRYELYNCLTDSNGDVWFGSWGENGSVVKKIDGATMEISNDTIPVDGTKLDYINSLVLGSDDYKFYTSSRTSLFGLKEDGTTDEIINWLDSDMNGDYIQNIFPVENGEFIVYESDWNTNTRTFYRLTKRDASEISNVQVLTMVTQYENTDLMAKVNEFNKANDDYRIKIESYSKYYEWDEESNQMLNSPETQLKMDIASGKTFDIICMNGTSSLYSVLGKKGAFTDLYELMGTDGTVSKDDILPNILEAGEYDGKLISLSPTFYVNSFMAKKKFVDKENWTFEDMFETFENLPEDMSLFKYDTDKVNVCGEFIATGGFIDFEKATCNFDSPEFIKLLEFCNSLDISAPDWESMSDEEGQKYWEEKEMACLNDKALLEDVYMSTASDYARYKYGMFNEDTCLVGYPSNDGHGAKLYTSNSYAIMANSPNKEVAWKFINQFFSEDDSTSERRYNFPSLKTAFEKKLDEAMHKPYYTDENGKKHEYENTYWINNKEIKIPELKQEERDELEKYLLSAKADTDYGADIATIIQEELETFFNGERSAEETTKIIQNRVSILVSEQY